MTTKNSTQRFYLLLLAFSAVSTSMLKSKIGETSSKGRVLLSSKEQAGSKAILDNLAQVPFWKDVVLKNRVLTKSNISSQKVCGAIWKQHGTYCDQNRLEAAVTKMNQESTNLYINSYMADE